MMNTDPTQDVFEQVLALPMLHRGGEDPSLVHLWWHAPQQGDRLVQVYVDGQLCDVSIDPAQHDLWLLLDRRRDHHLVLLAVSPSHSDGPWTNHQQWLDQTTRCLDRRAAIHVVKDESLPVDTQVTVDVNGKTIMTRALWTDNASRSGFGALFGMGDFGFDAACGPGLGRGELGAGPLGADGETWLWVDHDLPAGQHEINLTARNQAGQAVTMPTSRTINIKTFPTPACNLVPGPNFSLSWTAWPTTS